MNVYRKQERDKLNRLDKKQQKYNEHKATSQTLADVYDAVNPDKAERIRNCAAEYVRATYADETQRYFAHHCCCRLCAVCSWKRSEKAGAQTFKIADAVLKDFPDYRFILLTLTQQNCLPEELEAELNQIGQAFKRMTLTKAFKAAVKGYCKAIEITHNLHDDTFHPHMHVILVVHRNYFHNQSYIPHEQWVSMWQKALKIDYLPNVDIRRVKGQLAKAVAEVTKYAVKSSDYIVPDRWEFTIRTVRLLDSVLHNRRFFAFGGIFKVYHKRLNLSNPEDPDEDVPAEKPVRMERFRWFDCYKQYRKVDF